MIYPTAGSYPITLTVSQSGCVSTSTNQIVPIKTSPQIGFTIPPIVCQNDIINVVYTGAYNSPTANYVWNFGSSNILSGSGKGPYQIKAYGITTFNMQIFDRWGKLVYVSDSMNKLWKGEANGKDAPEDTYVYLIHVADVLGNDHDYKGRISIIK